MAVTHTKVSEIADGEDTDLVLPSDWNDDHVVTGLAADPHGNTAHSSTFVTAGDVAPKTADYLVGTSDSGLSAEIVVGTSPGGELGGTWASPTVDATHSGSAHHNAITIGADGEHSLATQVLSGVDATSSQKGHAVLGVQTTGGGIETLKAIGSSGSTETLALVPGTDGNVQTVANSASCTYTMPSGLTSGVAISFTLIVTNGGAFTAAFTGVKWPAGTAPTLTSGDTKVDIFTFLTTDGGTTWYGFVQQDVR